MSSWVPNSNSAYLVSLRHGNLLILEIGGDAGRQTRRPRVAVAQVVADGVAQVACVERGARAARPPREPNPHRSHS